jgi:hypothetical protein
MASISGSGVPPRAPDDGFHRKTAQGRDGFHRDIDLAAAAKFSTASATRVRASSAALSG